MVVFVGGILLDGQTTCFSVGDTAGVKGYLRFCKPSMCETCKAEVFKPFHLQVGNVFRQLAFVIWAFFVFLNREKWPHSDSHPGG